MIRFRPHRLSHLFTISSCHSVSCAIAAPTEITRRYLSFQYLNRMMNLVNLAFANQTYLSYVDQLSAGAAQLLSACWGWPPPRLGRRLSAWAAAGFCFGNQVMCMHSSVWLLILFCLQVPSYQPEKPDDIASTSERVLAELIPGRPLSAATTSR